MRLTAAGVVDASTPGVGILEIFHAGAWGTVCDGGFDVSPDDYGPPLTEALPPNLCLSFLGDWVT